MSRAGSVARELFAAALDAADPDRLVRAWAERESWDVGGFERVLVIAIGKAARPMARALDELLPIGPRVDGIVVTNEAAGPCGRFRVMEGDHPIPGARSLAAGRAVLDRVRAANRAGTLVVFAISGGASALCEAPRRADVRVDDLAAMNRALVTCGARIEEINVVRRRVSSLKGGRLARAAPRAEQLSLLISDVNPGDLASLGSGPTIPSPDDDAALRAVLEHYRLRDRLPASIRAVLDLPARSDSDIEIAARHVVLCDNSIAIEAAASRARSLGLNVTIDDGSPEREVETVARALAERASSAPPDSVFLSGGEAVCPVRGSGRGGRNLETALRSALHLQDQVGDIAVLSAGTDGIDGNSPAAGGVATPTTVARAADLGCDVRARLDDSDSFEVFDALGDAIVTGPTGTNVRDVRVAVSL